MRPYLALVLVCFFLLGSLDCRYPTTRIDSKYVESSFPLRRVSKSYSEREWNQFIQQKLIMFNSQYVRQELRDRLSQYGVDPREGVETNTGSKISLDLRGKSGLSNALLTLYSLGYPIHKGPLYYLDFDKETREAIQKRRPLSNYHYALDYFLIDSLFNERSVVSDKSLFRGANTNTGLMAGDVFRFDQFASATWKISLITNFVEAGGTIFVIRGAKVLPVSEVSQYPTEEEYILHPFQEFRVKSVSKENLRGKKLSKVILVRN